MDSATPTPSRQPVRELKSEPGNTLNATRYCFRVRVEDLPGPPLGRSITLANDFLRRNFHRSFSWDTDYVYTPVNIDGQGKAWVLLDVDKNVEPRPDSNEVDLFTFRVSVVEDSL
jgi:hypothetical protein